MLKLKKAPAILAALSVMFAAGFLASCSSDDNGGDSGPAKGTQGGNEGGALRHQPMMTPLFPPRLSSW